MNKKGQTLIFFVLIIPIFILLLAFIVDTGIVLKESTKLNSTMKTILKTTYEEKNDWNYKEKVESLFIKNEIPTENIILDVKENQIKLSNQYTKESIFGKIIGIKEYKIKNTLLAKKEQERIIIIKE